MTLARDTNRIESERLTLRRIEPADLEFFTQVHADPEVARYIAHGRPRSSEESRAWFQSLLWSYEKLALGQLAVLRKSDGVLLGRCGLSDLAVEVSALGGAVSRGWFQREDIPADATVVFERELGYTFHPSSWGHGYASEAASCVFEYARDVLKLARVISVIHPQNVRSLRIVERFQARREDVLEILSRRLDRFAWPISA